jgi:predicted transcriptional regulator of viral defense system
MTGYKQLALLGAFSFSDVEALTGNKKTAYSLLYRLMNKGLVKKVRSNLYTCVNVATGEVIASRYQIACACNNTAYLSHHTAFEYYGIANQVFYEVYVSSDTRFRDFEFEGIKYKYVASKLSKGIIQPKNTRGIRVTDMERSVVDNIKDLEKIGGLEELLNCLSLIHYLDPEKLINYLDSYNIQALYQKTGFILEHYMHGMQLTTAFIDYCKSKIGKSTRYLLKESIHTGIYNKIWRLIVPEGLFYLTEQGGGELV